MPYSIVFIAGTRYGGRPPQTDWQLGKSLARLHPLLYVEPPTFVHDAVKRQAWRTLRPTTTAVGSDLHVFRPVASPGADRPGFAAVGDAILERQIEDAARRVLPPGPRVVISCDPFRGPLHRVSRDVFLYHIIDKVPANPNRHPAHCIARHQEVIGVADIVSGVSDAIVTDALADGAKRGFVLRNGADYEHFSSPTPGPPELASKRTVVGYAGAVEARVDFDLVVAAAAAEPTWTFAFVGDVSVPVPERENIVVYGPRAYESMPAWMQRFDVGLIPLHLTPHILSAFPLKTYEYLAAGTPVVATSMPMLQGMEPYVRLADDAPTFVAAVRAAVTAPPTPLSCRELAASNSWDSRASEMDQQVQALLGGTDR